MATPKKKHSKQRTRTQYSAWKASKQVKILNKINLVKCSNCNSSIPERTICPECGYYKGEQIVTTKISSDTKVIKV